MILTEAAGITTGMSLPPNAAEMKHARFLRELAIDGNVSRACLAAGTNRPTVYARRQTDPEFLQQWQDAIEEYVDTLEAEAKRRAVDGVTKGVWHQGTRCGEEQQYSDSLLSQMLKAKRKEYRDNSKIELTGAEGGPLQIEETPTQIARRIAFTLALGMRAAQQAADAPDDGSDLA